MVVVRTVVCVAPLVPSWLHCNQSGEERELVHITAAVSAVSVVMDPPGGRDERHRQAERLRREEAYYHFINELSEEEYRLMRDSNLLGTPGEVTAEELRQRLDGAKERVSSQPRPETRPQSSEAEGSSGAVEPGAETSNGDSLLEWLNTFRRTGNATRSGQSGNQTWRAVSRTNPNSGEFRFSLEININHEQPEPGEHSDTPDPTELPMPPPPPPPVSSSASSPTTPYNPSRSAPYSLPHPTPYSTARPTLGRRAAVRRTRSSTAPPVTPPLTSQAPPTPLRRNLPSLPSSPPPQAPLAFQSQEQDGGAVRSQIQVTTSSVNAGEGQNGNEGLDCPTALPQSGPQVALATREPRNSRTRSRGRVRRAAGAGGVLSRSSRRSRSPLDRNPTSSVSPTHSGSAAPVESTGSTAVAMEMGEAAVEPAAPTDPPEAGEEEGETPVSGAGGVRRHPTIMLDLQVRRIRPGENRDRDSIASRTRSRARAAENTVTFESDSGGFRRTISRSERAGIRTYVSTIRIPLRRISETGLGEPSSMALRSILRQIMTGFGELSSLMETEADSETTTPNQDSASAGGPQAYRVGSGEGGVAHGGVESAREGLVPGEEEGQVRVSRTGTEGRPSSRDTNSLVENGTLPILRLAHFFLLNEDEDEEHPRGLTKEQIDNLVTRTYGQVNLEGELGRACSVCINEYAQGNKLRRLPCAHEFHIHCIDRWLSENNTCPICRQPILSSHQE
ncbi:E3 ubiquitin-protein ligase RNF6 [Labeo rohita]|uniref:RING-type E3 ubiquitin transferase n=2 Tax=Labeo rohita TaxID=84645 RepID=A0ABQ8LE50_LABRO|nr:E3 ubiquitin-protein ligase RNF6 [Labeo rohita]